MHNCPDIIIHNRNDNTCQIINIAIPNYLNIINKEAEKLSKYKDLGIEIQKCWNLEKVRIIPVICGALGTTGKNVEENLKLISENMDFRIIQKTTILGTAHIIRNVLTLT